MKTQVSCDQKQVVNFRTLPWKNLLRNNSVEMRSTKNYRHSFIAVRFIRTLRNWICKYMIAIEKNVYVDKLCDIISNFNNTDCSTTKLKPKDVTIDTYIEYNSGATKKKPKFENYNRVRVLKYKNFNKRLSFSLN